MTVKRIYSASFDNITVTAAQDLLSLKAGANNGVAIRRISLSASGVSAAAEIRLRLKRFSGATITAGSAGTAPTMNKVADRNPNSATATARANDTTQATTTGTNSTLATWNWDVLQDFLETPPTEEERWECDASNELIFDVIAAPASTVLSGFIVWEET